MLGWPQKLLALSRPATLGDVREILLDDLDGLRADEYRCVHDALANLYESCLPPLEEKYAKRPEDCDSWWWSGRGPRRNQNDMKNKKGPEGSGEHQWRVVAQEQVKFVRGSADEERLLFLLVAENDQNKRAVVPSPSITNGLEREFLVRQINHGCIFVGVRQPRSFCSVRFSEFLNLRLARVGAPRSTWKKKTATVV